MKILVVDDELVIRRLVECILSRKGHSTVSAGNGTEAMELVRLAQFDLVVSDVRMPGMHGVELVRTLRREGYEMPVLLVSGECGSLAADVSALVASKVVKGFLPKPFSIEAFTAAMED